MIDVVSVTGGAGGKPDWGFLSDHGSMNINAIPELGIRSNAADSSRAARGRASTRTDRAVSCRVVVPSSARKARLISDRV